MEALGAPTALVNNAGIGVVASLDDETEEGLRTTLDVNLVGVFRQQMSFALFR